MHTKHFSLKLSHRTFLNIFQATAIVYLTKRKQPQGFLTRLPTHTYVPADAKKRHEVSTDNRQIRG
jgi:hypothetical protein